MGGGVRVGINLSGLETYEINRGDIVGLPGRVPFAKTADAWLYNLPGSDFKVANNSKCKIDFGAIEGIASVKLIFEARNKMILPGEEAFVRLTFKEALCPEIGERFVLRNLSPSGTIGGGIFLDLEPQKSIFDPKEYRAELDTLRSGNLEDKISVLVKRSRGKGILKDDLSVRLDRVSTGDLFDRTIGEMIGAGKIVMLKESGRMLTKDNFILLSNEITNSILVFMRKHELSPGMKSETMKKELERISSLEVLQEILDILVSGKKITRDGDLLRLEGQGDFLSEPDRKNSERILALLEEGGFSPLTAKEMLQKVDLLPRKLKEYLILLVKKGDAVKVSEDLFYHSGKFKELEAKVIETIVKKGVISVGDFKEVSGTSRKYAIPLLEYFDLKKITLRKPDNSRIAGPNLKK